MTREIASSDGRKLVLKPTPKAQTIVAAIGPESRNIYQQLEDKYGRDHLERLLDLLNDLVEAGD